MSMTDPTPGNPGSPGDPGNPGNPASPGGPEAPRRAGGGNPTGPTPPRRVQYRSTRRDVITWLRTAGLHVLLTVLCFTMVLPFIWMALTSLKPPGQVASADWVPQVDPHLRPGHVRDPEQWVHTLEQKASPPATFIYENLAPHTLIQLEDLRDVEEFEDARHIYETLARDITDIIRVHDFTEKEAFADIQPGQRARDAYERASAHQEQLDVFERDYLDPLTDLLLHLWPQALPPDFIPTPDEDEAATLPASTEEAEDAADDIDALTDDEIAEIYDHLRRLAEDEALEEFNLTAPHDDLSREQLLALAEGHHTTLRRAHSSIESDVQRQRGLGNRYLLAAAFPELIIEPPRLQWFNYWEVLHEISFLRYYWNSIFVAAFVTFLTVLTSAMAAFSFSRLQWPGRDKVFILYLATMMVPPLVMMIPNYWIMISLGLVDTLTGLIVPMAFSAFGTFLLRQFMLTIPSSLDEAAEIDGASKWRVFWDVILPLARPGLVTLAIFTFLGNFHSFFWPLVMIRSEYKYTLPIGLLYFSESPQEATHLLMAAVTMSVIPLIIVFILLQRTLVRGIQLGAVKG